jgi:hypothetical protein
MYRHPAIRESGSNSSRGKNLRQSPWARLPFAYFTWISEFHQYARSAIRQPGADPDCVAVRNDRIAAKLRPTSDTLLLLELPPCRVVPSGHLMKELTDNQTFQDDATADPTSTEGEGLERVHIRSGAIVSMNSFSSESRR